MLTVVFKGSLSSVLDPSQWSVTILQYRLPTWTVWVLENNFLKEAGLSYSCYNCLPWEPENWWGLLIYSSATMCWSFPQWTTESAPWAFELGIGPSMLFRHNNCKGMQSNQPSRRPWESYWKVLQMGTSSFSWTSNLTWATITITNTMFKSNGVHQCMWHQELWSYNLDTGMMSCHLGLLAGEEAGNTWLRDPEIESFIAKVTEIVQKLRWQGTGGKMRSTLSTSILWMLQDHHTSAESCGSWGKCLWISRQW